MSNLPLKTTGSGIITGPTNASKANWNDLVGFLGVGHNRYAVSGIVFISPYDSTYRYESGSTGATATGATASIAIDAMLAALGNNGVGLIKAGSYGAVAVEVPSGIRFIVEKGAITLTVTAAAGATCIIQDYNAGRIRYYSAGVLTHDVDMSAGTFIQTGDSKALSFTIGTDTLTTTEFGYLDGLDQALKTTDDVVFNDLTISTPSNIYSLSHDSFSDYVVSEHISHTAVIITAGTGLTGGGDISATRTINLSHLGLEDLSDPNADRMMFWDDDTGQLDWLIAGSGLSIVGTTLSATGSGGTVTSIVAGDGMNFATITGAGTVTLGTPGNTTQATTSAVTALSHTHAWTHTSSTNWDNAYSKRVDTWGDGLQYAAQVASVDYNTANLKITLTELNTIQDIATSSSPTFNDLTISTPSNIYSLSHDSFADYISGEHFLQTVISSVSSGLTGILIATAGTLSTTTDNTSNWDDAYTHVSSTGVDHGYIDQDISTSASPTFVGITISVGNKIYLRDTGASIWSSVSNQLDFTATDTIFFQGGLYGTIFYDSDGDSVLEIRSFTDNSILELNSGDDGIPEESHVQFQDDHIIIWNLIKNASNDFIIYDDVNNQNVLSLDNGAATVVAIWSNVTHTGITLSGALATGANAITGGGAGHDQFSDMVANEHIDHSTVSISSGGILSGGGTITSTQTITLAHSDVDHDQTTNFVANEHINHTSVTITAGTGLVYSVGGTDISANATINLSHLGFEDLSDPTADRILFWDEGTPDALQWLIIGSGLSIAGTTLSATGSGGSVTSVAAGDGMNFATITGAGTVTLGTPSDVTQASTSVASSLTHTHAWTHTSTPNWDTAYSNRVDVWGVGLAYSSQTATLDLSELTTSTSDGDGDFFAVVDSGGAQKKLTKGSINLSSFNDDLGVGGAHVLDTSGPHTGTLPISDMSFDASVVPTGDGFYLGSATIGWAGLYLDNTSSNSSIFWHESDVDRAEIRYATTANDLIIYTVDETDTLQTRIRIESELATASSDIFVENIARFAPGTGFADAVTLGGTDTEWSDLYIGTGKVYFYTDQGESIRSDGSALYLTVATTDIVTIGTTNIYNNANLVPASAGSNSLGLTTHEWSDLYIGTGKVYFYTDQGESISSGGTSILLESGTSDFSFEEDLDVLWEGDVTGNPEFTYRAATETQVYFRPSIVLQRSRGSLAVPALVADNDWLGSIQFSGYDGGAWVSSISIKGMTTEAWVDGTNAGAELVFSTTANTTETSTDRWVMGNGGHFFPFAANTYNIGSAAAEVGSIYLAGTLYLFTDQNEWMVSDGTDITWGVSGSSELVLTTTALHPEVDAGLDLGTTSLRYSTVWSDTLIGADLIATNDLDINNATMTADNQRDVSFFGDPAGAQSGAYYSTVNIFGGSSQGRALTLYQVVSGDAYVVSTYNSLQLVATGAGSVGVGVTTSAADAFYPTVDSNTDLGTTSLRWATLYVDDIVATTSSTMSELFLTSTEDIVLGSETGALIVGMATGGNTQHIAIDGNEIMSKSDATTAGQLNLQLEGGSVIVGSSGTDTGITHYGTLYQYGALVMDDATTGSSVDSPYLYLRGNYYNAGPGDVEIEARFKLEEGTGNPYLLLSVDSDPTGGSPASTNVMAWDDTIIYSYVNFAPGGTTDTVNLGGASKVWNNIYMGTGKYFMYTDQNEYMYSDGTYVRFGVAGADAVGIAASGIFPISPLTKDLGSAANEWRHLYLSGTLYLFTDQAEYVASDGTNISITSGNQVLITQNSETIGLEIGTTRGYLAIGTGTITDDGTNNIFDGSRPLKLIGTGDIVVANNVVPSGDSTLDLGSDTYYWATAKTDEVETALITIEDTSKVEQFEIEWDADAEALVFNFIG